METQVCWQTKGHTRQLRGSSDRCQPTNITGDYLGPVSQCVDEVFCTGLQGGGRVAPDLRCESQAGKGTTMLLES